MKAAFASIASMSVWLPLSILLAGLAQAGTTTTARVQRQVRAAAAALGVPDLPIVPDAPQAAAEPEPPDGVALAGDALSECRTVRGPRSWRWCVTRTLGSADTDVVYYLHGHGGNAGRWMLGSGIQQGVRDAWRSRAVAPPVVVSVSFGGFWLLVEKNASPQSGLLEFFVDEALPAIERSLPAPPRRRLLFGESMGGFNAIQLVLKRPALFARAAIACPAVTAVSPYADARAVRDYLRRTGANPARALMALALSRQLFFDQAAWDAASPLALGGSLLGPQTPPLFISIGDRDSYGFQEGARLFAELARSRGAKVAWAPVPGDHCSADASGIAAFLVP